MIKVFRNGLLLVSILIINFTHSTGSNCDKTTTPSKVILKNYLQEAVAVLKPQIMKEAEWALSQEPVTITASRSSRSAGGLHDFYSEGDYWWPDSLNPAGPYIQKDGMTNPDNFVAHRLAMIRFSRIIGALASAYKITADKKYARHAFHHFKAWFINPETRMNANLQFAQAIHGRFTGRGIGIIDTIHLMEVAQGLIVFQEDKSINQSDLAEIKNWFTQYLQWLTSHPYGKDEMNAQNNHGTCYVMQVASFARLTGNKELLEVCKKRFKEVLLPNQMAENGSFPLELKRTKPYGYSIFNLDAMVMICQILSEKKDNLWQYKTEDGRSIAKAIKFLFPYVEAKRKWPYPKDVMYWDNWPVAQPFLIFGSIAFREDRWFDVWKKLEHYPTNQEVIRNLPIRNPLIWMN